MAGSALLAKYGTAVDNVSAYEELREHVPTGPAAPGEPPVPRSASQADVDAEARRIEEEILGRPSSRPTPAPSPDLPDLPDLPDTASAGPDRRRRAPRQPAPTGGGMMDDLAGTLGGALGGGLKSMVRSMGTQLGRELLRGVFGTSSRRRR